MVSGSLIDVGLSITIKLPDGLGLSYTTPAMVHNLSFGPRKDKYGLNEPRGEDTPQLLKKSTF